MVFNEEEYLVNGINYNPSWLYCQKFGCKGHVNQKKMECGTCFRRMTIKEKNSAMYPYKLIYFKKHSNIPERIRNLELL